MTSALPAPRRWRRWAAAGVVGAVAVTGCGSVAATPLRHLTTERAVGRAFDALGAQRGLTATISLGLTAAQVRTIEDTDHAGGVPAAVATTVPRTSLVVDLYGGDRTLAETLHQAGVAGMRGMDSELSLRVDGGTPVQLRSTGTTLYGRADIPTLLGDFGAPAGEARRVVEEMESANGVLPGTAQLARGGWVDADISSLSVPGSPPPDRAVGERLVQALDSAVGSAFDRDATYTNSGDHGGRTEYTVGIASRAFVDQLLSAGRQALSADQQLAPLLAALPKSDPGIPAAQRTTVQVWVEHGRVEELDLNLNQFAHKLPFAVPLRVVLAPGTAVTMPSGAAPINLQRLFSILSTGVLHAVHVDAITSGPAPHPVD